MKTVEQFKVECREIIRKIITTKDEGIYAECYKRDVTALLSILETYHPENNPRIKDGQTLDIKWRGSISDLATDIAFYFGRVQITGLIQELQYILDKQPEKLCEQINPEINPEIKPVNRYADFPDESRSVNNPEIKPDPVNPAHYKGDTVMVFIEEFNLGFCEGNAVKYIARHQSKGAPLEDLRKARWYLERAISNLETENVK